MKLSWALFATLLFISLNVQSQSLTRVEHTLRNGSSNEIASLVSLTCSKKKKLKKVKELVYLLEKPVSTTKIKGSVNSHDIIILMLNKLTEIPISDEKNSKVKAIISYQNEEGIIFRYHIINATAKELKAFKQKVKNWIEIKSHA